MRAASTRDVVRVFDTPASLRHADGNTVGSLTLACCATRCAQVGAAPRLAFNVRFASRCRLAAARQRSGGNQCRTNAHAVNLRRLGSRGVCVGGVCRRRSGEAGGQRFRRKVRRLHDAQCRQRLARRAEPAVRPIPATGASAAASSGWLEVRSYNLVRAASHVGADQGQPRSGARRPSRRGSEGELALGNYNEYVP